MQASPLKTAIFLPFWAVTIVPDKSPGVVL